MDTVAICMILAWVCVAPQFSKPMAYIGSAIWFILGLIKMVSKQ